MPTIESHRLGILSNSEVQELYGLPQLSRNLSMTLRHLDALI